MQSFPFDHEAFRQIKSALKNKCLSALDVEFKTVLSSLALHPDMAKLGIRDRQVEILI